MVRGITFSLYGETNLPTQEAQARKNARISCAQGDKFRAQDRKRSPPFRASAAHGLNTVFSRRERLSRASLTAGLKGGKRRSTPYFSAVFPVSGRGYAVIIPKKVARLSVTRHRMKRRVLTALRHLALPPTIIIFPQAKVKDLGYDELIAELKKLFS